MLRSGASALSWVMNDFLVAKGQDERLEPHKSHDHNPARIMVLGRNVRGVERSYMAEGGELESMQQVPTASDYGTIWRYPGYTRSCLHEFHLSGVPHPSLDMHRKTAECGK